MVLYTGSTVCGTCTCTSVVSGLAAVGSLTGSRQRVPQGADGRVLDTQRRTHQQEHRLPGALHPAPPSGSTSFTLTPPGTHTHTMRFHFDVSFHLHTCVQLLLIHTCRCLVLAAEQLLLEQLGALLKGTSTVEGKVFCHQLSRFPKPIQHILSYDLCNRIFCPFFFYTKTEV